MNPPPSGVDVEMTTRTVARTDIRRALAWGAFLAVLWVAVALIRPGTTFHLAPFLIAAAPPVLLVLDEGGATDRSSVLRVGAVAGALSLVTASLLLIIGAATGPVFEPFSTPMTEAIVLTAAGAVAGIGFGWWRTR